MKNGKVLAKLAQDKRVVVLNLTSDNEQVTVLLSNLYTTPNGRLYDTFRTAKGAHAFIKSAKLKPVAKEGHEMVKNLMTGKLVEQAIGTPRSCDVSSELYWSM